MIVKRVGKTKKDMAEIRTKKGDKTIYFIKNVKKVTITNDYTSITYTDSGNGDIKRVTTNLPFIYFE